MPSWRRARCGASVSPTTWPAPPSTCARGPAPTSPVRSCPSMEGSPPRCDRGGTTGGTAVAAPSTIEGSGEDQQPDHAQGEEDEHHRDDHAGGLAGPPRGHAEVDEIPSALLHQVGV